MTRIEKNTRPPPVVVSGTAAPTTPPVTGSVPTGAASAPPPSALPPGAPSRATREPQPGRLAELTLRAWDPAALESSLIDDLAKTYAVLRRLPPAVTFFGGARIQPGDPTYRLAVEIGRLLAAAHVPPRTGAGNGIMQAVPEGYLQGPNPVAAASVVDPFAPLAGGISPQAPHDETRPQGFNIKLPHEQRVNEFSAQGVTAQCATFAVRKLALYENARGLVTFPGGYGTLDELFEIWSLGARGKHHDPMVAVGASFWRPILDVLARVTSRDRALVSDHDLRLMKVTDTAAETVAHLAGVEGVRGFDVDPRERVARLTEEIREATRTLDRLPESVTFIGGRALADDDPACAVAREMAAILTRANQPVRVGGDSALAQAVASGVRAVDPKGDVQGFLRQGEQSGRAIPGLAVHRAVEEDIVHQQLIAKRSRAFVALPGGLGTLSELFTVLCQVQTGTIPKLPLILVGKSFWQPIFDVIRQQMLSSDRRTIAPEDLDLVTITDDPQSVLAALP